MTKPKPDAAPRTPVIWVVDDDSVLRDALCAVLGAAGYRVVQFAGSMGLLKQFDEASEVDLLITDVVLGAGEPHGGSLASWIRSRRPGLPCILITSYPEIDDDIGNGATLFRKPLDLDRFVAQVRFVLGR